MIGFRTSVQTSNYRLQALASSLKRRKQTPRRRINSRLNSRVQAVYIATLDDTSHLEEVGASDSICYRQVPCRPRYLWPLAHAWSLRILRRYRRLHATIMSVPVVPVSLVGAIVD